MNAEIINQNGSMKIKINNEIFNPQCFRSFRPEAKSIKAFAQVGIRLMNVFPTGIMNRLGTPYSPFGEVWTGDGKYNWDNLHTQMDLFVKNAPHAYFMLMAQLDTRDWFLKSNPDIENSFEHFIQTAGCVKWRNAAARFLCDLLDHLHEYYPEKIYAVMLCAGHTNEWNSHPLDYQRHSQYKKAAFRQWQNNPQSELPSAEEIEKTSWGILRHPLKDKDGIDYWRFHHEFTADTVKYFAGIVKQHTQRKLLVAAAQGYLMTVKSDILFGGSTGLWRTLDCEDIDILIAPASYWFRGLNSTSGISFPVSSFSLRNKLYIHSLDNVTHLANHLEVAKKLQNGFCSHVKLHDIAESRMYFRRETALAMSKGMGYWWFGMYPEWHDDPAMMNEIEKIHKVSDEIQNMNGSSISQIAVFVDEHSNYCLDAGQTITDKTVWKQVEQLSRIGAPWDNFHMNDINHENMPHDRYKFYIFLNLFAPQKNHLEKITALKKQGKSMLFLYAPGIITQADFSIEAMNKLAGINLRELQEQETKMIIPPGPFNKSGQDIIAGHDKFVTPLFFADDVAAEVIGKYEKSGKVSLALKKRGDGGFDSWSAMGSVPADTLRELSRRAGVFIFLESGDPLYANFSLLACFAHQAGKRKFTLPGDCTLTEMYTKKEFKTKNYISINFKKNEMKLLAMNFQC